MNDCDWLVNRPCFQRVNISAVDDTAVEALHSAILRFTGSNQLDPLWITTTDPYYAAHTEDRVVLIEDNDMATEAKVGGLCVALKDAHWSALYA
jgi:hypothetical protein